MPPSNQRAIHDREYTAADNAALAVKTGLVEVFRGLKRSSAGACADVLSFTAYAGKTCAHKLTPKDRLGKT